MTEPPAFRRFASIAQKWRDLIERRCALFIELQRTGAWKYNYTEAEFLQVMRAAVAMAETWSRLEPWPEEVAGESAAEADSAAEPSRRRTAARIQRQPGVAGFTPFADPASGLLPADRIASDQESIRPVVLLGRPA